MVRVDYYILFRVTVKPDVSRCIFKTYSLKSFLKEYGGHIGYDISANCRNRVYGYYILKLASKEAIAIVDVILTCNIHNIASKKVIEKNKGKLLQTIFDEEENRILLFKKLELQNISTFFLIIIYKRMYVRYNCIRV